MAFKVGDVVRLNAGGAWMTVSEAPEGDPEVLCVWHNPIAKGGFESKMARYPIATLTSREEHDRQHSEGMQATIDRMDSLGRRGNW